MTLAEVQQLFLDRLGLRLGPEMAAYVLRHLDPEPGSATPKPIKLPIIAGDAMTGIPLRQVIDLRHLIADA